MKKQLLTGLTVAIILFAVVSLASALTIDKSAWDGNVNFGWYSSGQSLTVDAIENHFDSIGFYFASSSWGKTFDFVVSDALSGGNILFSTSFLVTDGINVINIDQDMAASSTIYALIDYNGFAGSTVNFNYSNTYGGGQAHFYNSFDWSSFPAYDLRFIAEFSGGSISTPEPASLLLLGLGFVGLAGVRRFKK